MKRLTDLPLGARCIGAHIGKASDTRTSLTPVSFRHRHPLAFQFARAGLWLAALTALAFGVDWIAR